MATEVAFWDDLAEEYARKPVDNPDAFERKIAITASKMKSSDVVLDIGCGTGSLALRLAPHAAHVHGLDLSPEMMRIAKGKAQAAAVDNVTFHTGLFDASAPFEPASLDGVCAYSILHLVPDRVATLTRIYDTLKPGGFFVSSTVALGDSWMPYGLMLTAMKWVGKAPTVHVISRDTLIGDVRAAGFVDIELPDVGASSTTLFMVARKPI